MSVSKFKILNLLQSQRRINVYMILNFTKLQNELKDKNNYN
jgi:hypothetical protein